MSERGDPSPVVHVVVAGEVGGAERMLVDLTRGRAPRPTSVALITPNERLRAMLRDAKVDVDDRGPSREGPVTNFVRSVGPQDVRWLREILVRRRAKIVHLHTFASQVLGTRAALEVGARIIRTEHSTRVYDDPSCWPFSRWSLKRADVVACVSEHVERIALTKARWIEQRVHVIPNGVDLTRFADENLPRPTRPLRLLSLGRLEPRKGVDIALRAMTAVPDVRLDVVGDGPSRPSLERLSARLGLGSRVRFLGFSGDVRPAIASTHAALSSARAEGLGIALIEGMAMGRPVIALPTGGVPELVRDGETGWLAHGSTPESLARVIREANEGGPEELVARGSRARAFVVERFSVAAMRTSYERLYTALESRDLA